MYLSTIYLFTRLPVTIAYVSSFRIRLLRIHLPVLYHLSVIRTDSTTATDTSVTYPPLCLCTPTICHLLSAPLALFLKWISDPTPGSVTLTDEVLFSFGRRGIPHPHGGGAPTDETP